MHRLQISGQSAFWLGYEDLRDADVMTGLLHWLGRTDLERVAPPAIRCRKTRANWPKR